MTKKTKKTTVLHIFADQNVCTAGQHFVNLHGSLSTDFALHALVPAGSQLKQHFGKLSKVTTYSEESAIKQIIKEISPDIVHTHTSYELRAIAGKAGRHKTVHTQHSPVSIGFFAKLSAGSLSDAVIATNLQARESLVKMGTAPPKINMIYDGVTAVEKRDPGRHRKQFNVPNETFVVTCIAKLTGETNIILDAAKELPYNVITILIGRDNGHKAALQDRIKHENLENVRLFDEPKNISELMSITDAQIYLPSDTAPLPVYAGMSAGIPVIAAEGADPYIVEDSVNGLVIPAFTADNIDDAITRLKEDPPLYGQLSAGAVARYKDRFTVHRMANETEKVYRGLL